MAGIVGAAAVVQALGQILAGAQALEQAKLPRRAVAARVSLRTKSSKACQAGILQAAEHGREVTEDALGLLLEDRHHDRGTRAQGRAEIGAAHGRGDVGRRVAGQEQDCEADQPVPQAQHDPGQRDREQGQEHEIDRVQAVAPEMVGHGQGHDRHRHPDQCREEGTAAAEAAGATGVAPG